MSQSANPTPEDDRGSAFDAVLRRTVIEPAAAWVPDGVHPNQITLATPVVALLSFALAAAAPHMSPSLAFLFRVLAGVFMFLSMLTDHVDGLHARRTKQTSKLGEALDHWFDALHVPLAAAGFAVTLSASGWLLASVVITAGGVYNAQLVLYYDTKKFIYPPTGGASAQVMLAIAYAAAGVVLFLVPANTPHFHNTVTVLLCLVVIGQIRNIVFYLRRLGRRAPVALLYMALSFALTAALSFPPLQLAGPLLAALLAIVSLRINGSWILCTITENTTRGLNWLLVAWIVGLGTAGYNQWTIGEPREIQVAELGVWLCLTVTCIAAVFEFMGKTKPLR